MTNVQSVITTPVASKANGKAKAKANGSTSLTPAQAIDIAFTYGETMAGQDGALTNAFATFKANDKVLADMVQALTEGYMVRKLSYDRVEAKRVIGLKKYNQLNPAKNSDDNRTAEQERVMTAVRVLVSRAKRLAGITEAKPDTAVKAEQAKAEREAHESRLIKADEIINPADDVDAFDALNRLVLSMKSLQKKYAAKLVGDRGSEWREWLANAPR
jgi:hypothetical protein